MARILPRPACASENVQTGPPTCHPPTHTPFTRGHREGMRPGCMTPIRSTFAGAATLWLLGRRPSHPSSARVAMGTKLALSLSTPPHAGWLGSRVGTE